MILNTRNPHSQSECRGKKIKIQNQPQLLSEKLSPQKGKHGEKWGSLEGLCCSGVFWRPPDQHRILPLLLVVHQDLWQDPIVKATTLFGDRSQVSTDKSLPLAFSSTNLLRQDLTM